MPHAALWVVQPLYDNEGNVIRGFNAARGFVGGAAPTRRMVSSTSHRFNAARGFVGGAAVLTIVKDGSGKGFNAARGFVGGAATNVDLSDVDRITFQCRTRLCGWCSLVARSPFPPREKKPFWKVSGNLRCLTENM